jgi:subtilisin family serine protease
MLQRIVTLFAAALLLATPCFAQEPGASWKNAAQQAAALPKVTDWAMAMESFERGDGTGEFIINLKAPANAAEAENSLRTQAQKATRRIEVQAGREAALAQMPDFPRSAIRHAYDNIHAFSVAVTPAQLEVLSANPDVVSIDPVFLAEAHLAQGIPLEGASYYRSTYNGQGLSVAICDTGIDYTNAYLGGGSFPNAKVIGGYDVGQGDANPMDGNGHGTACAGIVAGTLASHEDYIGGVAYNAKLYAVKISSDATGGSAWTDDMVAGWDWCVTHQNDNANYPIMIISTSFGGGRYTSICDSDVTAMTAAAQAAKDAGITLFVSSGNDGYCDSVGWPSCISTVLAVGAVYDASFGTYYPCVNSASCAPTKQYDTGCPTNYYATDSTQADMVTSYSNSASMVSLFAPSNSAYTLGIGGSTYHEGFGGTSAACPYAAGAAAALQSAAKAETGKWLTPAQVKSILTSTGDLVTDSKVSITKPRVNLKAAIDRALNPVMPVPNFMLLLD